MFRSFAITSEVKEMADEWSEFIGNKHSIRKDGGNRKIGDYAEVIFWRMYPDARRISDKDRNADFVLKNKRIDVKAADRNGPINGEYECNIEHRQKDFEVDFYAFFSFNKKAGLMEFGGWISKQEFFDKARLIRKGWKRPDNGWVCSADCWTLAYKFLHRE